MAEDKNLTIVNEEPDDFAEAVSAAENRPNVYTHEFPIPVEFEGETFSSLTFDFGSLKAKDSLAIEAELRDMGKASLLPEYSGDYLIRMAMRACTTRRANGMRLGLDFYNELPMAQFLKIRGKARSFLLLAGS